MKTVEHWAVDLVALTAVVLAGSMAVKTAACLVLRKAEYLVCPKVAEWDATKAENLALKMVAC